VLVIAGDEDDGSLEPSIMLKRAMPASGLVILPRTGHTANLEEPELFNDAVGRFLTAVDHGEWRERDPRAVADSITGMRP
jgi:pimeloyl-ACP methyl ester carboxylesterase